MPDANHVYTGRGQCDRARWESLPLPANTTASDGPVAAWQRVVRQNWIRLSERVTLRAGDKVRISGGPYWEQTDADGTITRVRMGERGVMAFEEYCQLGQNHWIVARGRDGYAALHIGPEVRSNTVPGLVRRPYRLRKVRAAKQRSSSRFGASAVVNKPGRSCRRMARRGAA
jgi:hypothetical protein